MKNWKISAAFFVSFCCAFFANVAIDLACGGEIDPYDYYISFFHNNLQPDPAYKSFYFTEYKFLYDDAEPASEAKINATEWAQYLGKNVKPADVQKVMYGLDSASNQAVDQQFLVDKNSLPDSLSDNTFLKNVVAQTGALHYYQFAKAVEPAANFTYHLWEPTPVDTLTLRAAATKALNFAQAETDPFLKLRYYYQAQRLFHFGFDYQQASDVYDHFISKNASKSHVKGWALALKAGEERKLGDTVTSAYHFSRVFADYPERRNQAYRDYFYNRVSVAQVLPLAKTDEDKAVIYAINGFGNPEIGLENLQKVYQFQPKSPMVGVLLLREVNKLEAYYLNLRLNNITDSAAKNKPVKKVYADQQTVRNPYFGWLIFGGSVLLFIGLLGFILKKKVVKTVWQISSSFLLIAGGVLVAYAFFTRQKTSAQKENTELKPDFFTSVSAIDEAKYSNYIQKLSTFCDRLSAENIYPEAGIGNLTKAYLAWMQNKTADGFKAIAASENEKLNLKMQDQRQIVRLLLSAQKIQQLDSISEPELLPSLKWLDGKSKSTQTETIDNQWYEGRINRFTTTARNFYLHILAPAYLHQGDSTRAALALLKSGSFGAEQFNYSYRQSKGLPDFWYYYLRSDQLRQLVKWKENPPENLWLQFLTADLKEVNFDDLYDLLGTAFLREHNYAAAATAFAKQTTAGNRSLEEETGDSFLAQLNDYPKTFTNAKQGFTKADFAKAMAELQNQLKTEPENPQLYYRYATGLYNTSTYGNSWNLISYDWSSTDFARKPIYTYDADYVQTSNAERYYLKARALSNNADFKAKCTFMAAKCQQKQQQMPDYLSDYQAYEAAQKNYSRQMRQNTYFNELTQYKQTRFYKTAVQECSYLRDFITAK